MNHRKDVCHNYQCGRCACESCYPGRILQTPSIEVVFCSICDELLTQHQKMIIFAEKYCGKYGISAEDFIELSGWLCEDETNWKRFDRLSFFLYHLEKAQKKNKVK
jgi:hypothetical protein